MGKFLLLKFTLAEYDILSSHFLFHECLKNGMYNVVLAQNPMTIQISFPFKFCDLFMLMLKGILPQPYPRKAIVLLEYILHYELLATIL